ncbi:MAG: hypothetical protein AB7C97_01230 [Oscillospiraceae bacterium]
MTFEQIMHIRSLCLRCIGIVIMIGIIIYMITEMINGRYFNDSPFLSTLLLFGFSGGTVYGSIITYYKIRKTKEEPPRTK